jgi:hypothetical protein
MAAKSASPCSVRQHPPLRCLTLTGRTFAFGGVVRERHREVVQETQDHVAVVVKPVRQRRTALLPRRRGRVVVLAHLLDRNADGFGPCLSYGTYDEGGRDEFDEYIPRRRRSSTYSTRNWTT